MDRALHDALCIVKRTLESNSVVPGGGACEAALSVYLQHVAETMVSNLMLLIGQCICFFFFWNDETFISTAFLGMSFFVIQFFRRPWSKQYSRLYSLCALFPFLLYHIFICFPFACCVVLVSLSSSLPFLFLFSFVCLIIPRLSGYSRTACHCWVWWGVADHPEDPGHQRCSWCHRSHRETESCALCCTNCSGRRWKNARTEILWYAFVWWSLLRTDPFLILRCALRLSLWLFKSYFWFCPSLSPSGLDLLNGKIRNSVQAGVLEPAISKIKTIRFATEAAITILRIDDYIKMPPKEKPKNPEGDDGP